MRISFPTNNLESSIFLLFYVTTIFQGSCAGRFAKISNCSGYSFGEESQGKRCEGELKRYPLFLAISHFRCIHWNQTRRKVESTTWRPSAEQLHRVSAMSVTSRHSLLKVWSFFLIGNVWIRKVLNKNLETGNQWKSSILHLYSQICKISLHFWKRIRSFPIFIQNTEEKRLKFPHSRLLFSTFWLY